MKVASTVEFTDTDRRNVARFLGNDGLASHIQCVAWAAQQIRASLNVMAQAQPPRTDQGDRGWKAHGPVPSDQGDTTR